MTEHSTHAPHHSHVRKAIEQLHEHHARLQASHHALAAAEAERRAANLSNRQPAAAEQAQR